jgi:hypothetical protein
MHNYLGESFRSIINISEDQAAVVQGQLLPPSDAYRGGNWLGPVSVVNYL